MGPSFRFWGVYELREAWTAALKDQKHIGGGQRDRQACLSAQDYPEQAGNYNGRPRGSYYGLTGGFFYVISAPVGYYMEPAYPEPPSQPSYSGVEYPRPVNRKIARRAKACRIMSARTPVNACGHG